ncbi:TetR/AcrR family transcriptional regulator [Haloactinomyces albus]|uniref:AcrR family transcriptional regulator n=1 Tax=Haloactinomyces albus TaxID=1352928 RepID=A0AAE3ZEW8_9ACTN|nr:TetR/AcrR family transcriptional regulator [Haloactinomyces albus]MDR7301987.1 AcrR family transcriptional regulator [Haloactinomyces albus]
MSESAGNPGSTRRQRTRTELMAAMRALIEEHGFRAVSMGAVAEKAGVSRRTAYLHFASRNEMISALFDYVTEQEGLAESLQPVWQAPDAVTALDEWARHLARYHPRVLAVDRALDSVRRIDETVAQHREQVSGDQQQAGHRLAQRLHQENRLAPPWTVTTASDMIWALMSSDVIERLIVEREWPPAHFAEHLAALFRATFVTDPLPDEGTSLGSAARTG